VAALLARKKFDWLEIRDEQVVSAKCLVGAFFLLFEYLVCSAVAELNFKGSRDVFCEH